MLRALFEKMWGYMGTMAAMALMIGALGMGIYHAVIRDSYEWRRTYFLGFYNSSSAEEPVGIDEVPESAARQGGFPYVRLEHNKQGKVERVVYIGEDGRRKAIPGSLVAEQRLTYDGSGNLMRKDNYGERGVPVPDSSGVASRVFSYDDRHNLTQVSLRNAEGREIVPRMPGYARMTLQYDDRNRVKHVQYWDAKGQPITNSAGENEIKYEYDDAYHTVTRRNYENGSLKDNLAGYAEERTENSADGHVSRVSWCDRDGRPTSHTRLGALSVLRQSAGAGSVSREVLCGNEGVARKASRCHAERLTRLNGKGMLEWECFNAADGLPCDNPACGYAERVCEYFPDGKLDREYFWNAQGNPTDCYEKRYTYDEHGRHVISLHTDGSTALSRN